MIDLIRKGQFRKDEKLVFLHTGGSAALFGYTSDLATLSHEAPGA